MCVHGSETVAQEHERVRNEARYAVGHAQPVRHGAAKAGDT